MNVGNIKSGFGKGRRFKEHFWIISTVDHRKRSPGVMIIVSINPDKTTEEEFQWYFLKKIPIKNIK